MKDGDGADVDCTVRKGGGGYVISGNVTNGALSFYVSAGSVVPGPGEGEFTGTPATTGFRDPASGIVQSTECTITVKSPQEIGPGRVWATASCVNGQVESAAGAKCSFNAHFLFENCSDG